MKISKWTTARIAVLLCLAPEVIHAQTTVNNAPEPPDTDYSVSARDAHANIWQRTVYELSPSGQWVPHIQQYVETATGLNFLDSSNNWQSSSANIEPVSGGAAAVNAQHKVTFAADLATVGGISLQMPDGQQLRSHLVGLRYFDKSSDQSAFIAVVTNSIGEIVDNNEVWYQNAFSGLQGTVRYINSISGFEQNIVLEQCPQPPEYYGLNSATTVLQGITEFLAPPPAKITPQPVAFSTGQMADQTIDFPLMQIGRGRAFLIGDNDTAGIPVAKQWTNWNGYQVLIEQIPVSQIAAQLQALPSVQTALERRSPNRRDSWVASKSAPLLPARPPARKDSKPMKIASLPARRPGFLVDYTTLNTSQTNYVFQGDTTYFISGNVNLYGANTVFEGNTVIKDAANVTLTVNTPATWQGVPYRPIVMLGKDDNSAGTSISGSTGNPGNNHYATTALFYDGSVTGTSLILTNLRVANAQTAVAINSASGHQLSDVQLVNCGNGIAATNTDVTLRNALFYIVQTNFTGSNVTAIVEQLTSDVAVYLNDDFGTNFFLTNCILAAVTNTGNWGATQSVAVLSTDTGVFQTALPGGLHYLADDSPYRSAGTTNIDAATLADLQRKTTYPPIVYTNTVFWTATTFGPQAQRDANAAALGYHYDPLDYVFGGVISNANLTFTAGTAVGWYRTTSGWRGYGDPIVGDGINMANSAIADLQGTATAPCYFVRCNTVQEQDNSGGYGPGGITGSDDQYAGNISISPLLLMNFTKCISMADDGGCQFRDDWGYLVVQANNSELYNGNCGGYVISCYFTNCLWDRQEGGQVEGHPGDEWIMRNCTFHGGELYMGRDETAIPVSVRDCSFDSTAFSLVDSYSSNPTYTDYNYNAYTNTSNPFPLSSTNDVIITNGFNWQTSWFGKYYLPTNSPLINTGEVTANVFGLYHFTTTTNQVPETNSIVDIGYHYVATDSNGNPLDSNGDGIPDYIEDANGNGLVDSGEIGWNIDGDMGLTVLITQPKNNSLIP